MTEPIENSAQLLDEAIDLVLAGYPANRTNTPGEDTVDLSITAHIVSLLRDLRTITEVVPPRAEFVAGLEKQLLQAWHDSTERPQQRETIAKQQITSQRQRRSRTWEKPVQMWQTRSTTGRVGAVAGILLLVLFSALIIARNPNGASASQILKRVSDAGAFVPAGKVRHIITTTTTDPVGNGSETEEVWLANGTEHLLMWKPAPSFSNGQSPSWGYSLLVNDDAVWQFNNTVNKVYKLLYWPNVISSSGTLPDPQVIDNLLKSSDTHIVGTDTLDGHMVVVIESHVGSFVAGTPLDIAEGLAKGYDTAQHDFKLWIDKNTYQMIQEQHYITWLGTGPNSQHKEIVTRRLTTDELVDSGSAPSGLFTFELPAGSTLVDLASQPTPKPVERHAGWYNFTSSEGAFSVLMPRTPDESSATDGPSGHTELMYGAKIGSIAYVVRYADYPPDVIQKAGTENWLDSERDFLVISVPGKLMSERTISIDGYPGRELRVQADDGKSRIARLYLVRNRLYKVYAVMPDDRSITPKVEQFLDSFTLLNP
ncbi:MAG: hypothetical protein ABJA50_03640 [Chloroflexota bacterium]